MGQWFEQGERVDLHAVPLNSLAGDTVTGGMEAEHLDLANNPRSHQPEFYAKTGIESV